MRSRSYFRILCFGLILPGITAGCVRKSSAPSDSSPPGVPISQPVQRQVTEFIDFTGRTDAVQSVDIRVRVTGFLKRMPFKEGAEVKEGDLLFEVDPRPYQAQLDQAISQVELNTAALRLAQQIANRDQSLANQARGAVTQQQLDQDAAAVAEALARVKAAESSTEVFKLNLGYTRVTSPISGQISRYYLTKGNLVNQDQTLLTTVVALDPMYAYFDMDEPTLLRIRRAVNEGQIQRLDSGQVPVWMALQGEDGFPHKGVIDFVNNQVNPTTGSISVRGVYPNPVPMTAAKDRPSQPGNRLLSPGMFVRLRLVIGEPHPALLVIDRAIASDQGLKYVYVLDSNNQAQYRRVTTGPLQADGLRVITDGVKPDDWIIVGGLQQVRPRMEVLAEKGPMPTLARQPEGGEKK